MSQGPFNPAELNPKLFAEWAPREDHPEWMTIEEVDWPRSEGGLLRIPCVTIRGLERPVVQGSFWLKPVAVRGFVDWIGTSDVLSTKAMERLQKKAMF